MVGVSHATAGKWERGISEPSVTQFILWARATGQPVERLIGGIAETTKAPVDFSTEAFGLSQHSVRSKGLEPPTFWLVVKGWFEQRRFDREFARITKGLGL